MRTALRRWQQQSDDQQSDDQQSDHQNQGASRSQARNLYDDDQVRAFRERFTREQTRIESSMRLIDIQLDTLQSDKEQLEMLRYDPDLDAKDAEEYDIRLQKNQAKQDALQAQKSDLVERSRFISALLLLPPQEFARRAIDQLSRMQPHA